MEFHQVWVENRDTPDHIEKRRSRHGLSSFSPTYSAALYTAALGHLSNGISLTGTVSNSGFTQSPRRGNSSSTLFRMNESHPLLHPTVTQSTFPMFPMLPSVSRNLGFQRVWLRTDVPELSLRGAVRSAPISLFCWVHFHVVVTSDSIVLLRQSVGSFSFSFFLLHIYPLILFCRAFPWRPIAIFLVGILDRCMCF